MNSNGSYDWSFQVVGFYTAKQIKGDEMGAIINWNSFDEARLSLKGTVGYIMAKVSDVSLSNKISNIIDERYMNSSYATRSGPESIISVEMAGEIADVELIINAILMAVFFTILLVSGNTMAQSIRERRSDIGVLKCLGYEDKAIFIGVILEAITICFAAVIAGLIFTLLLIPLIEVASGGLLDDVLSLKGSTVLGASLIGLLIAFMAAAFPAHQALRLKVVDALREG
tara:strand:- start:952 stop:1635 length:684 start_codon:yes stop_codon:yes gene_type:complete